MPYELTWSCYEGNDKPCGKCGTCIDRQAAFEANGTVDPLFKIGGIMSGRNKEELNGVTLLGNQGTKYPMDYAPEMLETFVNKHQDTDYFVKFNCPEFTSLCPLTGQPDFATIYISYVPDVKMVESKSFKIIFI